MFFECNRFINIIQFLLLFFLILFFKFIMALFDFLNYESNLDIKLALFPFPLHVGEFPKILPISVIYDLIIYPN